MDKLQPGANVYFIGIKGTGVCAIAELLHGAGIKASGSDIAEKFYTDQILKELGIPFYENFNPAHINGKIDLVIHSAAYNEQNNEELAEVKKKSIPVMSYPQALGAYSAGFNSAGITGVHGKTTTTAMSGCLMQGLGLPAQVLVGSAAANFGGRSTVMMGNKFFIAETCEYRKHFLAFHPQRIVLTAVEPDHHDFFPDYASIRDAFLEYCRLIPSGGELIYCADDPGASEVAGIIKNEERGIKMIPYGFSAPGDFCISRYRVQNDASLFSIAAFPQEFSVSVPGRHQALNAAAALALASVLLKAENLTWNDTLHYAAQKALANFTGSKRRSEIIGNAAGILFMDDYGHHPTEITATLEGLRNFYPSRRIVVSFMSHTYSRTAGLLDQFASSLAAADVLFLHKIFASARELHDGKTSGKSIYEKIINIDNKNDKELFYREIFYIEEPMDAFKPLTEILKPGDLFLTLGAGNNWPLAVKLFEYFAGKNGDAQ